MTPVDGQKDTGQANRATHATTRHALRSLALEALVLAAVILLCLNISCHISLRSWIAVIITLVAAAGIPTSIYALLVFGDFRYSSGGSFTARITSIAAVVFAALWAFVWLALLVPTPRADHSPPTCLSHLKGIGLAIGMYQIDYGGLMPPNLQVLINEGYAKDPDDLRCLFFPDAPPVDRHGPS